MLTHALISKIKPDPIGKQRKFSDGQGMYLLAMPNGAMYWRLKYRWGAKEKVLALGVYPEVTLKEARTRRDDARMALRDGIDPGQQRRNERNAARSAAESSFKALALEWHKIKAAEWAPGHAHSVLRTLEMYLFPVLGSRPVSAIEPMELLDVLRKVERDGKLDTAKRLRERCDAIFRLAITTGRAKHNPAADLSDAIQAKQTKPRPALSLEKLPAFLVALRDTDTITLQTRTLFTLVMICFTRIGETVRAEWSHIDLDHGVWTIPAANRKLKTKLKATAPAHVVPLPTQAINALTELRRLNYFGAYVFPNTRRPKTHMSEATPLKALERMGYGGSNKEHGHLVTHGFRATASTILNEAGFNPDAVERQLSHKEINQVRAAYNRAAYLDERRKMLQAWADYLDAIRTAKKALPLNAASQIEIPLKSGSQIEGKVM